MERYPELVIDKGKLADNIREVTARCRARGISVAGVIKGMNGLTELIKVYAESDVEMIGSSRIEQIRDAVEIMDAMQGTAGCSASATSGKRTALDIPAGSSAAEPSAEGAACPARKPTIMIRIPMLSEVPDIVRYCDYSLESEDAVLRALNAEVLKQNGAVSMDAVLPEESDAVIQNAADAERSGTAVVKKHKVILMAEMGDLREGYVGDDLIRAALMVENELDGLELAGVGMNVGCYGSILPTREKLDEFVSRAEAVEKAIGRRLDMISGGATSSLMRVVDGDIPERIDHLRIGEGILLAHDLPLFYGCDLSFLSQDVFRLRMEVVELKLKPTYPEGTIGRDAFGREQEYVDRGDRMRAICACGKVDYGSPEDIFPTDPRIRVIGASSDHTLLDVDELFRPAVGSSRLGEAVSAEEQHCKAAADPASREGLMPSCCSGTAGESGAPLNEPQNAPLKVGDILEFTINYGSLVYVTASRNIHIIYK